MNSWDKRFTLTEDHIKLVRSFNVSWQRCETGAPEIDPKRPYGNSSVAEDVAEILGWEYEEDDYDGMPEALRDKALELHYETGTALQIILSTGSFEPGDYVSESYGYLWKKA